MSTYEKETVLQSSECSSMMLLNKTKNYEKNLEAQNLVEK